MDTPNISKLEDLPPQTLYALKKYVAELRHKRPSWSMQRVANKAAKKFNIKLVNVEESSSAIPSEDKKGDIGK